MSIEDENERLGAEYRAARRRAQECDEWWRANPIAYTVGPGARVPATSAETLLGAAERGMPDEAWREAMAALDRWRAFRAAHGMP